jgi:hypothetical protein
MRIAMLHYGSLSQKFELFKINYDLVYNRFLRDLNVEDIDKYFVTSGLEYEGIQYLNESCDINDVIVDPIIVDECEQKICDIMEYNDNVDVGISKVPRNKIAAIVYKNYRLQKGYDIIRQSGRKYDVIVCCRADCKCMFNFDKSQLYSSIDDNSIYVIGPHWWRPLAEIDCSPNDEYSERMINSKELFFGVDLFFAKPAIISEISTIYSNLESMYKSDLLRAFHDETIFQDMIYHNNINVKLMKWNPVLTVDDFEYEGIEFLNMNKSYIPIIKSDYKAIRT